MQQNSVSKVQIKTSEPPGIPDNKRLPTHEEYKYMSGFSIEIDRLRGLISSTSGEVQEKFIRQRRDVNQRLIDYMNENNLYYVPKSNYFRKQRQGLTKNIDEQFKAK